MPISEAELQAHIRHKCGGGDTRLFRNNVGMGWIGKIVTQTSTTITLQHYRPLHAGLCAGSSDLIGWTKRDGRAIFTAIEVKAKSGRLTDEQNSFIQAVRGAGGIAGAVKCLTEAYELLGMATS